MIQSQEALQRVTARGGREGGMEGGGREDGSNSRCEQRELLENITPSWWYHDGISCNTSNKDDYELKNNKNMRDAGFLYSIMQRGYLTQMCDTFFE